MPPITSADVYPANKNSLIWEQTLNEGLNQIWYGRSLVFGGQDTTWDLTSTWNVSTGFNCPASQKAVAAYSKEAFDYPIMTGRFQAPNWSGLNEGGERDLFFGFENGENAGGSLIAFQIQRNSGNNNVLACEHVISGVGTCQLFVHNFSGAYVGVTRTYRIYRYKYFTDFWMDNQRVAFIAHAPNMSFNFTSLTPTAPYGVAVSPNSAPVTTTSLVEINQLAAPTVALPVSTLTPDVPRVAKGVDIPSMRWALQQDTGTNTITNFAGLTITTGNNVNSAAFPIIGFGSKRIRILCDGVVTVTVQVLDSDGTWRNSVATTATPTVANTALELDILDKGVLARVNVANASGSTRTLTFADVILLP